MRQALIGCLLTAVVVVAAITLGALLYLYLPLSLSGLLGFDEFSGPEPGIRVGEGVLEKRTVTLDGRINWVTDFVHADIDAGPGTEFGVTSPEGILVLDADYNQLSYKPIVEYVDEIRFVYSPAKGQYFAYNMQSWYEEDLVSLFDMDGKQLWTFENPDGAATMRAGDVNGDGEPEFCVIYSNDEYDESEDLIVLDGDGQELWRKDIDYTWDFAVADLTGDGIDDICVFDESDRISIEVSPEETKPVLSEPILDASMLTPVAWPAGESARTNLLLMLTEKLQLIDGTGNTVQILDAPDLNYPDDMRATAITFEPGGPAYLAVIVNCFYPEYTQFYLYAPEDGRLVYYEAFSSYTAGLLPIYSETGEGRLLVGGDDCLYEYTLASGQPAAN